MANGRSCTSTCPQRRDCSWEILHDYRKCVLPIVESGLILLRKEIQSDQNRDHDQSSRKHGRKKTFMKIPFAGGCACGAIRYECTGEPILMFKCHCRDCQKLTSGGFAANLKSSRSPSEFWPAHWMIRVGFSRRWTFSFQTRSHGIRWIPRFRNSSNIRHHRQG